MLSLLFAITTPKQFPVHEPKTAQVVYADPIIHISPVQPISALPELDLKEIPELELKLPEPPITSSGNTYPIGQCTQYAKARRPDIPNNLGNADMWYSNLQSMGWSVGTEPRPGAIGQQGMHVVYVEQVKGNKVYISERNWDYAGSYRERWADASDFLYIY